MSRRTAGAVRAASRARRILGFTGYFAGRLVVANVVVAREILTPGSGLAPGIVDLPLRCRTPAEIATFANLITLTPGTLTLEIEREPPMLFVHGMHADDPERFRDQLRDLERRLLAAMRPAADGEPSPVHGKEASR